MISKRVMLLGAVVVGGSYVLAMERVSLPGSDTHLTNPDTSHTSVSSAQVLPRQPGDPAHATDARVGRQLAELASGMEQMKSELTALRGDAPQKGETAAPTPTAEQVQAAHDEYMAGVERAFEREPRDEQWAQGTAQSLRQTLESEPIMFAALRGIECRSSSCRMEIRDDGSATFAEEFPLMVHHMGAVLPEVRFGQAALGDGAQLHILYMTKSADEP